MKTKKAYKLEFGKHTNMKHDTRYDYKSRKIAILLHLFRKDYNCSQCETRNFHNDETFFVDHKIKVDTSRIISEIRIFKYGSEINGI